MHHFPRRIELLQMRGHLRSRDKNRVAIAIDHIKWYLFHVVEQATGDRKWNQAMQDAERMAQFQRRRRRSLAAE